MKFLLNIEKNNQTKVIEYDSEASRFTDLSSGELFFKSKHKTFDQYSPIFTIAKPINHLYIMMGMKCNFKCKYCHQLKIAKTSQVADFTPSMVDGFIAELKNNRVEPRRISLWGGEPLVYWKTLLKLIPELRKIYPETKINFPTNGSLLTKDKIQFLTQHHIGICLSYDGTDSNRGNDEGKTTSRLLEQEKVVQALQHADPPVAVMPTLNKKTISIQRLEKEFSDKSIPIRHIALYTIARCSPYNAELANEILITKDSAKFYEDLIYSTIKKCRSDEKSFILYHGLIHRLNKAKELLTTGTPLSSDQLMFCPNSVGMDVTVDGQGKIFNCMNIPVHVIGNIRSLNSINFETKTIFQNHLYKDKCYTCPYIVFCKGGCPMVFDENSNIFEINCSNLKVLSRPMFRAAMEDLFDGTLTRISLDGSVVEDFKDFNH